MLRLLTAGLLIAGAVALATGGLDRLLLYLFDPREAPPPEGISAVDITAEDGTRLVAWQSPPAPNRPVVLYFHGNAGNLAVRAGRLRAFAAGGFGVLAAGYRGSSGSGGAPDEAALIVDAQTLAQEARARFGPAPLVYYGESLGAAVAIALAAEHPPAALVLEAPFASVAGMAGHLYRSAVLARLLRDQWPSRERIAAVSAPLLVLHGDHDELVPRAQARAVFDAAASPDKRFLPVANAGHNDVWQPGAQRALLRFIARF